MPTYEYECKKCRHTFEVFQAMSDEPIKKCPKCGKQVRRLISGGIGVIFKGSGFYVTDKDKEGSRGVVATKGDAVPKGEGCPKKDACPNKDGCPIQDAGSKGDTVSKSDAGSKGDGKGKEGKAKPAA